MTHESIKAGQAGRKESTRRKHHQAERAVKGRRSLDDWGDLDQFSANASRSVLHHMTEEKDAAGISWEKLRPE